MNPFYVNYKNFDSVVAFAFALAKRYPQSTQYVVKYPDRDNFNITMQKPANQSIIVWSSK